MPTLPGYESKNNIRTDVSQPLRNEATRAFANNDKIIGTMTNITQKWSDANDVMQYTEARAKNGLAIAEIKARASADQNFKNSEQYAKELAKVRAESLKGIDNQQVASKLGMEIDHDIQVAQINIGIDFQQKQLKYNQFMVKTSLDSLMQDKLSATTPAEAQQYDLKMQELLTANVNSGTISYEEANKLIKDAQETSVKYEVYNDNATQEKDSALLKELKDPKGKYSFLDPDTRLKMIEESQRRIFQNNQTYKREAENSRDQRFNDVFEKANEGTLSLNDLDVEMRIPEEQGGIPKKQLLDIRRSLQSRIKTDLENITDNNDKAAKYVEFVDNFIADETDRQKGREAIVNAFKDNILSPKEAAFLNRLKRETEDIQWSKQKEGIMSNNLIPFKNAIFGVMDWFRGSGRHNEKEAALAIKKMMNGIVDGKDPGEVMQEIIKDDNMSRKPQIKTFPTDGQRMVDPVSGVTAIVFPDGHYEIE